jgi:LEA14-like dessication related protein
MKRFIAIAFVILFAGCATVDDAKPPSIQLLNLRLGAGGLLNQELLIEIRIGNPNDFDLPLTGLTFQLDVNGQPFADGLSNTTVTVPRLGYATVPVTGQTNILSVFRQLMFLGKTDRITYRLHGTAYVGRLGINQSVPYERKGELSLLPDSAPGAPGNRSPRGGQDGARTLAPVDRSL